eukprot:COSAG01_NODE_237_length_20722_cov_360.895747_24_plen_50_part_01
MHGQSASCHSKEKMFALCVHLRLWISWSDLLTLLKRETDQVNDTNILQNA